MFLEILIYHFAFTYEYRIIHNKGNKSSRNKLTRSLSVRASSEDTYSLPMLKIFKKDNIIVLKFTEEKLRSFFQCILQHNI